MFTVDELVNNLEGTVLRRDGWEKRWWRRRRREGGEQLGSGINPYDDNGDDAPMWRRVGSDLSSCHRH